jgi:hypothetical protein
MNDARPFAIPTPTARHAAANAVRRTPMTAPERDAVRGLARALRLALARVEEATDLNDAGLAVKACSSVSNLGTAALETARLITGRTGKTG